MAKLAPWLITLTCLSAPAAAHDFWIEPASFTPRPGARVGVGLRVGEGWIGDPVPRRPAAVERFEVLGPEGRRPLPGVAGVDPAGLLDVSAPGAYWLLYESRPRRIRLAPPVFESYLREEGLERILDQRARAGDGGQPATESYRRCAKALVVTRGASAPSPPPIAGCRLELVPVGELPSAGGPVRMRLLFDGRPLAGALVAALERGAAASVERRRSDGAGVVSFDATPGVWLVKAVHMEAADPAADVDWESWWASLTFAVGDG